ncbi:hypothetical protein [Sciscionella sediminilitoris]|uniref:phage terminase small subunit n=1 Tax=Sciscionella sediminilitoris TaxID=1445613 RepID=UPI0004DF95A9|nr:hypothetical protein [Sciscionella sp. SE31]
MPQSPKPTATRQRRNKTSTAAKLSADHGLTAPELPPREQGWHALTLTWWVDVWASPMAPEFTESDVHGLLMLAALHDDYWTAPASKPRDRAFIAAEIRLQEQRFGLSPIDRRRLQWEIEKGEDAAARTRKRKAETAKPTPPDPANDPRNVLRAVQ